MKKVHKTFLAAPAIVLLFSLGACQCSAQSYFEGEIVYKLDVDNSMMAGAEINMPDNITLLYKGNKMKKTTSEGTKKEVLIYNFDENITYDIDHDKETIYKYVNKNTEKSLVPWFKNMEFTVEAKSDTPVVAGYKCKRYVITAENDLIAMTIDFFTSDAIKVRKGAGSKPLMLMGFEIEEITGFPMNMKMKVTEHIQGMMMSMIIKAEEVNEKKLSDDLFKLPEGYKMVEN